MHRTRGVLIRNFGRRQDPGLDDPRLEIQLLYTHGHMAIAHLGGHTYTFLQNQLYAGIHSMLTQSPQWPGL